MSETVEKKIAANHLHILHTNKALTAAAISHAERNILLAADETCHFFISFVGARFLRKTMQKGRVPRGIRAHRALIFSYHIYLQNCFRLEQTLLLFGLIVYD
jgi:hypothetical protein